MLRIKEEVLFIHGVYIQSLIFSVKKEELKSEATLSWWSEKKRQKHSLTQTAGLGLILAQIKICEVIKTSFKIKTKRKRKMFRFRKPSGIPSPRKQTKEAEEREVEERLRRGKTADRKKTLVSDIS